MGNWFQVLADVYMKSNVQKCKYRQYERKEENRKEK